MKAPLLLIACLCFIYSGNLSAEGSQGIDPSLLYLLGKDKNPGNMMGNMMMSQMLGGFLGGGSSGSSGGNSGSKDKIEQIGEKTVSQLQSDETKNEAALKEIRQTNSKDLTPEEHPISSLEEMMANTPKTPDVSKFLEQSNKAVEAHISAIKQTGEETRKGIYIQTEIEKRKNADDLVVLRPVGSTPVSKPKESAAGQQTPPVKQAVAVGATTPSLESHSHGLMR
ncbi:MAG: hypothetical protein HY537_03745 [Deltaproteobacteria bacterium]|nr:hypothetical protein [Deltaproteobacteria bacterium]